MYGNENVVASDIRKASDEFMATGPFVYADVMNYSMLERIVVDWRIGKDMFGFHPRQETTSVCAEQKKKKGKGVGHVFISFFVLPPHGYLPWCSAEDEQFPHPSGAIVFSFFCSRAMAPTN